MTELQQLFVDDKGWDSEDAMIRDVAASRRERMDS